MFGILKPGNTNAIMFPKKHLNKAETFLTEFELKRIIILVAESDKRSKARLCDGRPECDHFEDECTESCANVTALPEFCRHLISEMAFAPGLS